MIDRRKLHKHIISLQLSGAFLNLLINLTYDVFMISLKQPNKWKKRTRRLLLLRDQVSA